MPGVFDSNTGYKGVGLCNKTKKWRSRITVGKKRIMLGRFDDIIDAATAYDKAAIKFFGEFAVTNF